MHHSKPNDTTRIYIQHNNTNKHIYTFAHNKTQHKYTYVFYISMSYISQTKQHITKHSVMITTQYIYIHLTQNNQKTKHAHTKTQVNNTNTQQ